MLSMVLQQVLWNIKKCWNKQKRFELKQLFKLYIKKLCNTSNTSSSSRVNDFTYSSVRHWWCYIMLKSKGFERITYNRTHHTHAFPIFSINSSKTNISRWPSCTGNTSLTWSTWLPLKKTVKIVSVTAISNTVEKNKIFFRFADIW